MQQGVGAGGGRAMQRSDARCAAIRRRAVLEECKGRAERSDDAAAALYYSFTLHQPSDCL